MINCLFGCSLCFVRFDKFIFVGDSKFPSRKFNEFSVTIDVLHRFIVEINDVFDVHHPKQKTTAIQMTEKIRRVSVILFIGAVNLPMTVTSLRPKSF